jgi:hypothetical protein
MVDSEAASQDPSEDEDGGEDDEAAEPKNDGDHGQASDDEEVDEHEQLYWEVKAKEGVGKVRILTHL